MTNRSFILICLGLFYIKGTKYFTFRQYITNSFNGNAGMYQVMNHHTRPAPEGTVNFGYHESKTGKNIMKVEAIDIRKGTGKALIKRNAYYRIV